jgi:threonine synthase
VAGIIKFVDDLPDGPIVCTVTGHGLKDPDTATTDIEMPNAVAPTLESVVHAIGWT